MKARKTTTALLAAALLAAAAACGDTETEWVTAPTVSAAQAAVTAPDGGGTASVAITVTNPVDGATISASPSASWVAVTSCTETAVSLSVSANPNEDPRTARVTVSYSYTLAGSKGSCSCEITVAQSCGDQPFLSVQPTAVAAAVEGGTYSFEYTIVNPADDGEVSATCGASWITDIDTSKDGVVSFSVAENSATTLRQAEISISYSWPNGSISETVTVVQDHTGGSGNDDGDDGGDGDIEGTYTITGICYNSYPYTSSWAVTIHYEPNSQYTDSEYPYLIDGLIYAEVGDYPKYAEYCAKAKVEGNNIIVPSQITEEGFYYLDETYTTGAYLGYVAGYIDGDGYLRAYDNYPDMVFTYSEASGSWSCNYGIMGFLYDTPGNFNSMSEYFIDFTLGDITLRKSGSGGGGGGGGGGDVSGILGTYTAAGNAYAGSGVDAATTWTLKIYEYNGSVTANFPNYSGGFDCYIDGLAPSAEGSYDYYGDHRVSAAAYIDASGNLVVPTQVMSTTSSGYYVGWTPCTLYSGSGWSYNYGWPDITFVYNSSSGCWESEYGVFMGAFTTMSLVAGTNSGFYSFFDVVSPGMTLTKTSDTTSLSVGDTGRHTALESLETHFDFKASYAPVPSSSNGIKSRRAGARAAR